MGSITGSASSPRERIQANLLSQISSGAIKANDKSALTAALDTIDTSLKADRKAGATSGKRPDRAQFESKIKDLISSQVESGALTLDQATELKQLFSKSGPPHGGEGPGGAGGPPPAGGPPGVGGPPPAGGHGKHQDNDDDDKATSQGTSSTTSATASLSDSLTKFLKALQETRQSSSGYNAGGTQKNTAANSLSLVDLQA